MEAKKLHADAEHNRERGNFVEALALTDQAMVAYLDEDNPAGFAEVIASRFLTLRHLFEKTGKRMYLILAKHEAQASVELADATGDKSAKVMPLFNLAKAQETLGEHAVAVGTYRQALEIMESDPPAAHNRPCVVADMKIHLGISELNNGDDSAEARVKSAASELAATDEPKYNKDVWLSGAYLKLAEALRDKNRDAAKRYLDEAEKVIKANPDLSLRQGQWQKLAEKFN